MPLRATLRCTAFIWFRSLCSTILRQTLRIWVVTFDVYSGLCDTFEHVVETEIFRAGERG
jgi:hypothetical protein